MRDRNTYFIDDDLIRIVGQVITKVCLSTCLSLPCWSTKTWWSELLFQSPTRRRRWCTSGCQARTRWDWRATSRCLSLISSKLSPGSWTSPGRSQSEPSRSSRWFSSSRDTRATSSSRWSRQHLHNISISSSLSLAGLSALCSHCCSLLGRVLAEQRGHLGQSYSG